MAGLAVGAMLTSTAGRLVGAAFLPNGAGAGVVAILFGLLSVVVALQINKSVGSKLRKPSEEERLPLEDM